MAAETTPTTATLDPDFIKAWQSERDRARARAAELERRARTAGLTEAEVAEHRRCCSLRDERLAAYCERTGRAG